MRSLWRNARLLPLADAGRAMTAGDGPWGLIEQGAMISDGDTLRWVGRLQDLDAGLAAGIDAEHDLQGALVTPGLIDCHTHLVYAGNRSLEFELRLNGADYPQIARSGGGILATVAATRAAGAEVLYALAADRARALIAEGVTTVEVKSGYGLDLATEATLLRVARRLASLSLGVRTSFLGAHALPPEFAGAPDDYITQVCSWLPLLHAEGLVDAVDAFCDHIAFTPAQTCRVFEAARALGLPVKLHAEQLSDQGGTQLACRFAALSCDHLEYLSEEGVGAMARSGSVAVLLPGAFYSLRETRLPPIALLRRAGVPMAIATDHNPGTSPTLSPLLMLNMACTLFRLTPLEAVRGVTVHAARALGLADRGRLMAGLRADFCCWALEHPRELAYPFGTTPQCQVVQGGVLRDAARGQTTTLQRPS